MCAICVLNMWHIWPIWCVTHVVHVRTSHMLKRCDIVSHYASMFVWFYSQVEAGKCVLNVCNICDMYAPSEVGHMCSTRNTWCVGKMCCSLSISLHIRVILSSWWSRKYVLNVWWICDRYGPSNMLHMCVMYEHLTGCRYVISPYIFLS